MKINTKSTKACWKIERVREMAIFNIFVHATKHYKKLKLQPSIKNGVIQVHF